jgi:hypothetical protein
VVAVSLDTKIRCGSISARSAIRLVRLPVVAGGTSAGMVI